MISGRIAQAGLENDLVYSIAGRADETWVGRERGGLTRLRRQQGPAAGSFTADTYTTANGLAQNSVYSVYETRDGTVWAGTLSGGVSRLRDGKFTTSIGLFVCVRLLSSRRYLFGFLAGYFFRGRWLQCGKDDGGGLLDDFERLGQQ